MLSTACNSTSKEDKQLNIEGCKLVTFKCNLPEDFFVCAQNMYANVAYMLYK